MTPSGTMVVRYSYDAWGNILSITGSLANSLGKDNPFRYRSYYYDNETGWYYLQSRYYDPSICRFISPDDRMLTGESADGLNLYAYCGNNPVNRKDPSGNFWVSALLATTLIAGCTFIFTSSSKLPEEPQQVVKYDVPVYNQGSLSLCWAYCQTMIESYQNGIKLTQKEATNRAIQIAKNKHNSDSKEIWNEGAFPDNLGARLEIDNINQLYNVLVENGPVYAYYINPNKDNCAHLIVVTGVNLSSGIVYTNNPWGVQGKQSFTRFSNGVAKKWWQSGQGLEFSHIYLIKN